VPYLRDLGATHLYVSPILTSRAGSEHGYDVVDPTALDPELGTRADLAALSRRLRGEGMGLIVDIVPNHMAASVENPWLRDVLARGTASPFAEYFDIDWGGSDGRLVLPILAAPFEEVLKRGGLRAAWSKGEPVLRYEDWELPVSRATGGLLPRRGRVDRARVREIHGAQAYRLVHWRDAGAERNYRRFFDIGDLVALRMEDPAVFEAVHRTILGLVGAGLVQGLRVDHVDGLHDPEGYLRRLRGALGPGRYLVVEKILARDEALPRSWPVDGTTGYEALGDLAALTVDPNGLRRLGRASFAPVALRARREVLRDLFHGEIRALALALESLGGEAPPAEDLRAALEAVTVHLPVYRTYIRSRRVSPADRRVIDEAVFAAREETPALGPALAHLRRILFVDRAPRGTGAARLRFVMRWQQLTGAVAAKGVEDTALYRFGRLLSVNDVGSDPGAGAMGVEAFHRRNAGRLRARPRQMVSTSTHDTKRSEDVRARIAVLSEVPAEWTRRMARWRKLNRPHVRGSGTRRAPDPGEEAFLYQTLVGLWPFDAERAGSELIARLGDYAVKAAREAKLNTSWLDPDEDHEAGLRGFCAGILGPGGGPFVADLVDFQARVAPAGAVNALAQALLKLTIPGVPDLYQGTETWNLTLVDPDNRGPVDFERARATLEGLDEDASDLPAQLVAAWPDGRIKTFVISRVLRFRRAHPELFEAGSYRPAPVAGPLAGTCAFARRRRGEWLLVAVPRLVAGVARAEGLVPEVAWRGTTLELPPGAPSRWRSLFTGRTVQARGASLAAEEAFGGFPVAALEGIPQLR
jgi:malto-oligosyltrehalose synthase